MRRGSLARFGCVIHGSFASVLVTILICTLFPFGSAARAQTQADAASGSPKNFFAWLTECPLLASDKDPQPAGKPGEPTQPDLGLLTASSDGGGVAGIPAGNNSDPATPPDAGSDTASPADGDTLLSHPKSDRFWISGQYNLIAQWHPGFHAQYSGPHSFGPNSGQSISSVVTLFTGFRLNDTTELVVDPESATSTTPGQGFAGYPNLDIAGGPPLSAEPYLARLWLRKIIPLSKEEVNVDPSPVSMLTSLPVRRLEFHVGKLAMADFFDLNSVGSDTHMQFINWTVNNNGAWDYPADPRGYTYAAIIEYFDHDWAARFGEALEPNGSNLEWNLQRAHSETFEVEYHPNLIPGRFAAIRALAFMNHANMGDYGYAISQFRLHNTATPDIDAHPYAVTMKCGFGLNMEQELTEQLRAFMRAGWNEGEHETWGFTEADQTLAFGADLRGDWWGRQSDKLGAALVFNGMSHRHQQYLAMGGVGMMLGDGNLAYGHEKIFEAYYNFPIPRLRGVFGAFDVQYIDDPGYNRDRGPVVVSGMRLHIEL